MMFSLPVNQQQVVFDVRPDPTVVLWKHRSFYRVALTALVSGHFPDISSEPKPEVFGKVVVSSVAVVVLTSCSMQILSAQATGSQVSSR